MDRATGSAAKDNLRPRPHRDTVAVQKIFMHFFGISRFWLFFWLDNP